MRCVALAEAGGVAAPSIQQGLALPAQMVRSIVEHAVAAAFQVPLAELRAPTRRKAPIAFARQVAMYLMHVAYGLSMTEVGILFGRDRTTVAHACCIVEDRRDDDIFDRAMEQLERAIAAFAAARALMRAG